MKKENSRQWRSFQSIACTKMPFGKHAGEMFKDIPTEYLQWIVSSFILDARKSKRIKAWVIIEIKRRKEDPYKLCPPKE